MWGVLTVFYRGTLTCRLELRTLGGFQSGQHFIVQLTCTEALSDPSCGYEFMVYSWTCRNKDFWCVHANKCDRWVEEAALCLLKSWVYDIPVKIICTEYKYYHRGSFVFCSKCVWQSYNQALNPPPFFFYFKYSVLSIWNLDLQMLKSD